MKAIKYLNPYEACVNLKCPYIDSWFEDYLDDNNTGKLYDKCEKWLTDNYAEVIFSEYTCEVVVNLNSKAPAR